MTIRLRPDPDFRQPREHTVPCSRCRQHTLNIDALCDDCYAAILWTEGARV